jgi:hypothetical protein
LCDVSLNTITKVKKNLQLQQKGIWVKRKNKIEKSEIVMEL